jgi:hypothetical protein
MLLPMVMVKVLALMLLHLALCQQESAMLVIHPALLLLVLLLLLLLLLMKLLPVALPEPLHHVLHARPSHQPMRHPPS